MGGVSEFIPYGDDLGVPEIHGMQIGENSNLRCILTHGGSAPDARD